MKKACIQCGKDARLGEVNNVKNVFCATRCQVKYYLVGLKDDELNINDDNLLGLVTSDGIRSIMSVEMAEKIPLLKKMMEGSNSWDNYIPLKGVDSTSLVLIREFIEDEKIIDSQPKYGNLKTLHVVVKRADGFSSLDNDAFLNLLKSANYLLFEDFIYYLMTPWIYQRKLYGLQDLKILIPLVVFFHRGPLHEKLAEYANVSKSIQIFNATFDEFNDNTGFATAVALGNVAAIEALVKLNRSDPSFGDNYPIREASKTGNVKMVEFLLTLNWVNPGALSNDAIQKASVNGHLKVVELLLKDKRVDPSDDDNKVIIQASKNGHVKVVELLLKDKRVDPTDDENNAIVMASRNGHVKVVTLLLKDGRVDPSAQDNRAIRMAFRNGHVEVVKLLLEDPRVDPNLVNLKRI
jgi:ankyrin repeat protein